jgi:hypothetical protein
MKIKDVSEFVLWAFLLVALALVALYAFENLALSDFWFAEEDTKDMDRQQLQGLIEAELVELTLAILVIISLATALFSTWFGNKMVKRVEDARDETIAKAMETIDEEILKARKMTYEAASAGYYHELAFQMFELAWPGVQTIWHGQRREGPAHENAVKGIEMGLYYSSCGLEYIADYEPLPGDFYRHRRVPWHIRNTFVWFHGAHLIVHGPKGTRGYYDDVLAEVDKLCEFAVDIRKEHRPSWYQIYESCAFFLAALDTHFPGEGFAERARQLLEPILTRRLPKAGLAAPPAEFVVDTRDEYEKAGLI